MDTIKNINDEYTTMFVNEETNTYEELLEGKTFYLEASDGSVLCKYKKWNQKPEDKQVKWFGSYRGAKSFITKNHLGIVSIKDKDFTKRDFGTSEEPQQVTEAQHINPVRLEKIIYREFKMWLEMLDGKFGQGNARTLKIIRKVVGLFGFGTQPQPVQPKIAEDFSPNQNDGDVKVTMVFKGGKMVNWGFAGKPKTKDMLNITKLAPFIKKSLSYNKEKKIFMWKKEEEGTENGKDQNNDDSNLKDKNDKGNDKDKVTKNKEKDEVNGKIQNLTEASTYE